jgi:hypothetical protein
VADALIVDSLRDLVEALNDTGHTGAATICEQAADHIDDLNDKLTAAEDLILGLERLLEGLSTVCNSARLACNPSEGDAVPVLEVSRG